MIEINNNKDRNIIFEVQLSGITPKELTGYFRMYIDGLEYGFPAEISENSISVDIPSLKNIVNRPLRSGEKIKAKLELVGNENYIVPWEDSVTIKSFVMVEAKIIEDSPSVKKPMVKVLEKKDESVKSVKKVSKIKEQAPIKETIKSEQVTTEHLKLFMEKNGTTNPNIQEIILRKCIEKVGDDDNKRLFKELYNYYKKGPSK